MQTPTLTATRTNGHPTMDSGPRTQDSGLRPSRTGLCHSPEHIAAATAHLPAPAQTAVRNLFQHGKQNKLSLADLGHQIGYDASTVSKLFNGKYKAEDLAEVTQAIEQALRTQDSGLRTQDSPIIARTSVVEQIEELCLLAWLKRRIVFIFGPAQRGKTAGVRHFQREHPAHPWANRTGGRTSRTGSVKIVETPANGGARGLLNNLAIAYHVSPQSSWEDLKLRAFNQVSPDDLIIIDEFSQCFDPVSGSVKVRTIRLAREIWNHCQCGLVIVMTDIARDEMQKSRFVKICNELWYRKAAALELPAIPSDADLKLIAQAHGLPVPGRAELTTMRDLIKAGGMTQCTTLLEMANDYATDRTGGLRTQDSGPRTPSPTWANFNAAHDLIKNFALQPV